MLCQIELPAAMEVTEVLTAVVNIGIFLVRAHVRH